MSGKYGNISIRKFWTVNIKELTTALFITSIAILTLSSEVILSQQAQAERISISELKSKLESGVEFLLIDVRRDQELKAEGAIPGAIHIPVAELDERMKDIPNDILCLHI